jgi:hypothetical protein
MYFFICQYFLTKANCQCNNIYCLKKTFLLLYYHTVLLNKYDVVALADGLDLY